MDYLNIKNQFSIKYNMIYGFFPLNKCFDNNFKSNYSLIVFYRKTKNVDVFIVTDKKERCHYYVDLHDFSKHQKKVKDNFINYNNDHSIGLFKNEMLNIPLTDLQFKKILSLKVNQVMNLDFLYKNDLQEWMI